MKTLVILRLISTLFVVTAISESPWKISEEEISKLWQNYKLKFNKVYTLEEEKFRQKVWQSKISRIQRHNLEYDLSMHGFTLGLNEYSDLTDNEYRKYLLGFRPNPRNISLTNEYFRYKTRLLPDTFDWREYGYVTDVKNQGQCGSCWAFSSTGALEGQHFRLTGQLVSLSEQNLVDCCNTYGNAGCHGGWMMNAFKYVQVNDGIDTEESYPYEARDGQCRYQRENRGAQDSGYVMIPQGDETALKTAIAEVGPISVAIDASHSSFQLYRSGVYVEPECSSKETDHAVLVVGYGVDGDQDYWLVKNSWGTSWGMDGYIKMARNKNNQCGIASFACYPTI